MEKSQKFAAATMGKKMKEWREMELVNENNCRIYVLIENKKALSNHNSNTNVIINITWLYKEQ
jgi:hypothetical protein